MAKQTRRRRLSEKVVRDALIKTQGNAAEAARALQVSRSAVWHYIDTRPEIRQIVTEFREELADHAEASLFAAVKRGEGWAIRFALTQTEQGRARGYGPAQGVQVASGVTVKQESDCSERNWKYDVAVYLESIGAGRPEDFDDCRAT